MAKVSLKVKWGKSKYDVDVETNEPVELFKAQLFALTGVPPDRQVITAGTKKITDATDLTTVGLKDNQLLMLLGTADAAIEKPKEAIQFIEDMADKDMVALIAAGVPFGLENIGNTCYMNSTVQLLKHAEGFSDVVKQSSSAPDPLVKSTADLFQKLDRTHEPVRPERFWASLCQRKPEFAQMSGGPNGGLMQQDAEECLTEMLNCLNVVKTAGGKGIADENFGIEMQTETSLAEAEGGFEEPHIRTEKLYKLSCHIQGSKPQADGSSKGGTDLMPQGIMHGLEGTLEKNSPSLGRQAVYTTKSRVARLPKYVMTQLVRFYYKADTQKKCKIMRPIKFPFFLDMHDYCKPDLQAKIKVYREKKLAQQREEEAEAKRAKFSHGESAAAGEAAAAGGDAAMEVETGAASAAGATAPSTAVEEDEDCHATYQLIGVLTHKGTSADGGHYVSWTRKDDGTWFLFDDDKVSEVKVDKIKALDGTSAMDHMAYMCLYQRTPQVFGSENTRYEEAKSAKDQKKGMK